MNRVVTRVAWEFSHAALIFAVGGKDEKYEDILSFTAAPFYMSHYEYDEKKGNHSHLPASRIFMRNMKECSHLVDRHFIDWNMRIVRNTCITLI